MDIVYSLLSAWYSQLYNQPRLTLRQVKDLYKELHLKPDIYAPSISVDKASINQQIELYLRYKRYKQTICDVFPIIAANALKTELCITNEFGTNSCDFITLPPRSPIEIPNLYLHRIHCNHYNGLQRSPAPYSSQCLAIQPSAALVTPAEPNECHIKPSAALSTTVQDECHTREISSFPALSLTQHHTTSAAPQIGHLNRPSVVLTAPALQSHVSSSVSAQSRHQIRPFAVPPAIPQVDNHAVLHSPSQVICQTKSTVAQTPWQIIQGWPVPGDAGSSTT